MHNKYNKYSNKRKADSFFGFQFHRGDLLARLLVDKLRMSPLKLAAYVFPLGLGYGLFQMWIQGDLEQWRLLYGTIFIPLIAFAYIWTSVSMSQIMQRMQQHGPTMRNADFSAYLRHISRVFNHPFWSFFSVAIAILGVLLLYPSITELIIGEIQLHEYRWQWLIYDIGYGSLSLVFYYALTFTFIRGALTTYAVRKLVADVTPMYDPFHPDGWAGFAPIYRFTVKIFYFLVGAASGIIALSWAWGPFELGADFLFFFIFFILPYVTAIVILVFAPIMFVRNYIHKQKEQSMQKLMKQAQPLYHCVTTTSNPCDIQYVSSFTELIQARKAIGSFNEWPGYLQTFWKIVSIVVTALVPIILTFLLRFLPGNPNI